MADSMADEAGRTANCFLCHQEVKVVYNEDGKEVYEWHEDPDPIPEELRIGCRASDMEVAE